MVVPFGISIGDFVALGQLAHQIATALSDCRGAAAEYKSLIELLKSLKTSVGLINDFVSSSSFSTTAKIDQAFLNGLSFHAGCCSRLLNQFMVDSRKYTERLINGRGCKAQTMFRKLKWSLYSAEDARKLEQRLTSHLEAFDRYLLAVDIQLGAQSTQRLESQVGQVSHTLAEITKSVQTMQLKMPRYLGYPWEGDAAFSYVYLDDVLGRSTILPAVLCRNFSTFHDTLKIMFSDHPGFKKVADGHFEIIDETNHCAVFEGSAIGPSRDPCSLVRARIKPGTKLSMGVQNVRTLNAPRDFLVNSIQNRETCPNCRFETLGRNFRKCASRNLNCDLSFRKTILEISDETRDWASTKDWRMVAIPRHQTNTSTPTSDRNCAIQAAIHATASVSSASQSMETELENNLFRRVHNITQYLVPTDPFRSDFGNSRLPLIQAIGQGNVQWVRELLLHTDTDPNCRSFSGLTALQQACSNTEGDSKAVVELLIAAGAEVNATPGHSYGLTALQAACGAGNEEVVELLVGKGADTNAKPEPMTGRTALSAAVFGGHFGIVEKLLDLGADINRPKAEYYAYTALSAAVYSGDVRMMEYLVDRGAEVGGEMGSVALEVAIFRDQWDAASSLLRFGVNVDLEIDGQAPIHSVRSLRMLDILVAHGAQVKELSSRPYGYTALQNAAGGGNLELVEELIRLGADVHAPGPDIGGRTALQSAALRQSTAPKTLAMIKLLIDKYGADVNEARSREEGCTCLEGACYRAAGSSSVVGVVEFLLERGAKVTPFTLHAAAARGNIPLALLLLRNGARIEEPSKGVAAPGYMVNDREFGETAIETARLHGHEEFAKMLEAWVDPT